MPFAISMVGGNKQITMMIVTSSYRHYRILKQEYAYHCLLRLEICSQNNSTRHLFNPIPMQQQINFESKMMKDLEFADGRSSYILHRPELCPRR